MKLCPCPAGVSSSEIRNYRGSRRPLHGHKPDGASPSARLKLASWCFTLRHASTERSGFLTCAPLGVSSASSFNFGLELV